MVLRGSIHWGGACWRNLPNDFKLKTLYGVGRDWPIGYDDLEPFYHQAEVEMGVSGSDTDDYSGQGGAPRGKRGTGGFGFGRRLGCGPSLDLGLGCGCG